MASASSEKKAPGRSRTCEEAGYTQAVPVGQRKSPRTLPDVVVPYTTFSEHVRRDFADSLTAAIFHHEGDALVGTTDSPTEFFQTVAATYPGRSNVRRQIKVYGRIFALGDIVNMEISASVRLIAVLQSTEIATDGEVSLSPSEYASGDALRVGDLTATLMLTADSARPALLSSCLTSPPHLSPDSAVWFALSQRARRLQQHTVKYCETWHIEYHVYQVRSSHC